MKKRNKMLLDFEETQEPKKEEEPVVPAQTVPVPKTGDSWW